MALGLGCDKAPDELPPSPRSTASKSEDLGYTVPTSWTLDKSAQSGTYRAKYSIPKAGDAKHDAELLVQRLGPGTKAKVDAELESFLKSFEGPGLEAVRRETIEAGEITTYLVALEATYKFPMGPRVQGRPAASVIKEGWAGAAAGVMTPDRGNWLFTLIGPEPTIAAARAEFRAMLASLK